MKKRLISFLLLITVLLSTSLFTASCGKNRKVSSALRRTAKLEDIDADVNTTFKIEKDIKCCRQINIRVDKKSKNETLMCIGTTLVDSAMERSTSKIFVDNDTVYVPEKNNTGYTISKGKYFVNEPAPDEFFYGLIKDLPDSVYENVTAKKKKDDDYITLNANLSAEDFSLAYSDYMNGIRKMAKEQLGAENVTFNTCHLIIKVREGYVHELSISYDIRALIDGNSTTLSVSTTVKLNDLKKDIDLRLPVGKENYIKK